MTQTPTGVQVVLIILSHLACGMLGWVLHLDSWRLKLQERRLSNVRAQPRNWCRIDPCASYQSENCHGQMCWECCLKYHDPALEGCRQHRCVNCKKDVLEHLPGKCLFGPTHFSERKP